MSVINLLPIFEKPIKLSSQDDIADSLNLCSKYLAQYSRSIDFYINNQAIFDFINKLIDYAQLIQKILLYYKSHSSPIIVKPFITDSTDYFTLLRCSRELPIYEEVRDPSIKSQIINFKTSTHVMSDCKFGFNIKLEPAVSFGMSVSEYDGKEVKHDNLVFIIYHINSNKKSGWVIFRVSNTSYTKFVFRLDPSEIMPFAEDLTIPV